MLPNQPAKLGAGRRDQFSKRLFGHRHFAMIAEGA
jgi:hypothetical protein